MPRTYPYVGPDEILADARGRPGGTRIDAPADAVRWLDGARAGRSCVVTWVVAEDGGLLVADRHSEHVACAGCRPVLGAGELTFDRVGRGVAVVEVTNQSTGYCPEPECWAAIAAALDAAGIPRPDGLALALDFRRCPVCAAINVVKEGWFVCACGADLPVRWNLA